MSPILVRPIREQFEHNRLIRLLQVRLRRRYLVEINIEDEHEATGVRSGADLVYPDLVLTSTQGARRVHGIVEVETAESVNPLEALAEWTHFGKVRGAFYLYVPAGTTDIALQLCQRFRISIAEIWSYHAVGDQMRFTMTHRSTRAASRATAAARRLTKGGKKTARGAKRGVKSAKRTVRSTPQSAKKATSSPTPVKRTSKAAKRSPKTAKRTAKDVRRTATAAKKKTGERSGRSAASKAGAKATRSTGRTTKKTVKGAKRGAVSDGSNSSRASTSAASALKARRRSPAAGTRRTPPSRRVRKQR